MVVGGVAAAVEHGRGREIRGKDSDDRGAEALTHSLPPSGFGLTAVGAHKK